MTNNNFLLKTKALWTACLLFLSLPFASVAQHSMPVDFDECVDLVSVVWHLAGAPEYNNCRVQPYMEMTDEYFDDYRGHEAVMMALQLYRNGVGYDAVADYGSHLEINEQGDVVFSKSMALDLDQRWSGNRATAFLDVINDFYSATDFHEWFESTEPYRQEALTAFQQVAGMVDRPWFDRFYGPVEDARFRVILCLLAGVNNYGLSSHMMDGTLDLHPVISSASYADGAISFRVGEVLPLLIHEFCHTYCNPLIDSHFQSMASSATQAYQYKEELMRRQAYGSPKVMLYETLVRASVVCYMAQHFTPDQVNAEVLLSKEESNGFVLVRSVYEALNRYATLSDQYPNIESYMPQVVKAVNQFSLRRCKAQQRAAEKHSVKYKCNIKDGAANVPSGLFVFTITFDRPMDPTIALGIANADFPEYKSHEWSDDAKVLRVTFMLRPDHEYGIRVMGAEMRSTDGHTAVESSVRFHTQRR